MVEDEATSPASPGLRKGLHGGTIVLNRCGSDWGQYWGQSLDTHSLYSEAIGDYPSHCLPPFASLRFVGKMSHLRLFGLLSSGVVLRRAGCPRIEQGVKLWVKLVEPGAYPSCFGLRSLLILRGLLDPS